MHRSGIVLPDSHPPPAGTAFGNIGVRAPPPRPPPSSQHVTVAA